MPIPEICVSGTVCLFGRTAHTEYAHLFVVTVICVSVPQCQPVIRLAVALTMVARPALTLICSDLVAAPQTVCEWFANMVTEPVRDG